MRRYREPALAAFLLALLASLAVHLPVYEGLGRLAKHLFEKRQNALAENLGPIEVSFEPTDSALEPEREEPEPEIERKRKKKQKRLKEKQERANAERAQPVIEPEQIARQAVQQKSRDPKVEPPPDARYIAEENQRVEEETAAKVTNYVRDAERVSAGKSKAQATPEEAEGRDREDRVAEFRNKEGSDARTVTEEEAKRRRQKEASKRDPIQRDRVARNREAQNRPRAQQPNTITITDSTGTFIIQQPSRTQGKGAGVGKGANLKLSWSQFESAVGSETLEQSRHARIQERQSLRRGKGRTRDWEAFRAALENFTPSVRRGNQTALNAAASPFANYIAAVHRRIHRQFADRFLAGLGIASAGPMSDETLRTQLEIVLNRDGSVHRVGIVRSSGLLPFDYGAFNSVLRGQPYAIPPNSILSGDGRVYFHWGFYRNHRQCGTFNAEPYILPNPPRSKPMKHMLDDGPALDKLVPFNATPTWGTEGEPKQSTDDAGEEDADPKKHEPHSPPPPRGAELG